MSNNNLLNRIKSNFKQVNMSEYEIMAIESFTIENYLYESIELIIWWFLYKKKYISKLNIFEFLGIIQNLSNTNPNYIESYYNQLYIIEPNPEKITMVTQEVNITDLRKNMFEKYKELKILFPEIVFGI